MTNIQKTSPLVQIFGTDTCLETSHMRRVLEKHSVPYEYVDVQKNIDAGKWLESVTGGRRSTPVVDFFGDVLIQPTEEKIIQLLRTTAVRQAL